MERDILLLGNPRLYEISEEVKREELEELRSVFTDMFDCIRGIRRDYGFGRAIAAPQIGVQKRLICILTDQPYVIINPRLEFVGNEMMELWMIVCHFQIFWFGSDAIACVFYTIWTRTGKNRKCIWKTICLN